MFTTFKIKLAFRYGWREQLYPVVVVKATQAKEYYLVCGRNRCVVFESNRPYYVRKGLRHRRPHFRLCSGTFSDYIFAEKLVDAIWEHLQRMEKGK